AQALLACRIYERNLDLYRYRKSTCKRGWFIYDKLSAGLAAYQDEKHL
ncbi:MAG: hypothetical protein ACI96M_004186, partial [Candidatus Azotimanducaceae bacterium]